MTDNTITELLDAPKSAVAEYQPFYAQLAELEKNNSNLVFDYESRKGNKDARSHVNTLRLTKGALERTRKSAKDESLKIGRAIDAEANQIEARIEAMILVHQAKIDEIKKREEIRVGLIQQCIENIRNHGAYAATADALYAEISILEVAVIGDDYVEFKAEALTAKDSRLQALRLQLAAMQKAEAEQAELERLRNEAAERAQKDRDDAIAKAATERARAEAALQAEQEAAKARQLIIDAERKAEEERGAAERRELELKLQKEQAERRILEAEQKAKQDAVEAVVKAEKEKAEAVIAEQARVAAVAKAEADETARREQNKTHLRKINQAALAALIEGGIGEECGKECIKLIALGKIPAVTISY